MPFNKINITLTAAQMSDIAAAIDTIINTLPVKFNLTKAERISLANINSERYPYVQRAIENHGPANPTLVSGYAGTQAEAANDLVFYDQMKAHILRLRQALEIYEDTQQVAGSEAYTWTRMLYNSAKDAAANQVPGADTVADDLATLFGGQGGGTPAPPPATGFTMTTDQTTLQAIILRIAGNASATGTEQFKIDFGDGNEVIGTLENGTLANYLHDYNIPGADASGIYTITITPVTAGAFSLMGVLQFDNCRLKDEVIIPAAVKPTGIQIPNNHITNINMQAASYANLTSLVPFNNDMTESSVNANLIGLDNNGLLSGFANFGSGTNAAPTGAGIAAKNNLIAKGWTVITN